MVTVRTRESLGKFIKKYAFYIANDQGTGPCTSVDLPKDIQREIPAAEKQGPPGKNPGIPLVFRRKNTEYEVKKHRTLKSAKRPVFPGDSGVNIARGRSRLTRLLPSANGVPVFTIMGGRPSTHPLYAGKYRIFCSFAATWRSAAATSSFSIGTRFTVASP